MVGSFGSLLSRSFFQLTWPISIRPIPRKTSNKIIFIDFFVDFSDFARTAENPVYWPIEKLEKQLKKDMKCTKIAGFTVTWKKNGKFQIFCSVLHSRAKILFMFCSVLCSEVHFLRSVMDYCKSSGLETKISYSRVRIVRQCPPDTEQQVFDVRLFGVFGSNSSRVTRKIYDPGWKYTVLVTENIWS